MTSKLVVNTIEADTGISSVSFASSISLSSTSKFFFGAAGIDIGADTNINRPAAGVLGFNINGTEKVRITSDAKVGIGEDPTISQFQVKTAQLGGTAGNTQEVVRLHSPDVSNTTSYRFTNYRTSNGTSHTSSELRFRRHVDSTDMGYFGLGDQYVSIGYGTAEKFRITNTGKVGINLVGSDNTSPVRNLDIADSSGAILRLISTDDSLGANERLGEIEFYSDDDDNAHIGAFIKAIADPSDAAGRRTALLFGTQNHDASVNAVEKLRIDCNGKMGLGTASIQTNAKLQVVGNVGAAGFYTTTTSAPQTDFNSDVATNKAGLLLRRSSETNGDYSGLEFHNHPSSNTSYRKGGIYFQSDGSGFGRGDMVFVNDGAGDSANLQISDEKLRIESDGQHVKTKGATRYNNSSVTYYELPVYLSSSTTHTVFTISGSYDSGFVAFATLEYIGLYGYAGINMSGGVRRAYTRRTANNTNWRAFNNQVSENYGENHRPDINWVNGVLQVTTPGSTQITGYIRLAVHANSQSNYTVTLNHSL